MKKENENTNNSKPMAHNTLPGCIFCHGTGMAEFVDMDKVPIGTSMVMGDEIWKKYEEVGKCPEGCQILN